MFSALTKSFHILVNVVIIKNRFEHLGGTELVVSSVRPLQIQKVMTNSR